MYKNLLLCLLLFSFSCCMNQQLFAQTTQASISGTVSNNEKIAQQGASVAVRNESTGFVTKSLTNAKGEYTFKELPLGGPYTIDVTYTGYGAQKRSGYSLNQGDAVRVDITMQVQGTTLEVVQVVGSGLKTRSRTSVRQPPYHPEQ